MHRLALACLAFAAFAAHAQTRETPRCEPDAKWAEPAPPIKVFGNTYFVGTCGISAILVTSNDGAVLIDAGVEEAAPLVEANIRALGIQLDDVRYILNSHEHYDHVGGLAALAHDTHATIAAREPGATALERGRGGPTDPQFKSARSFPAVASVRRIADGDRVRLGTIDITAHATPAHTPGSTSWTWISCEGDRCLRMVYADSLTAVSDEDYRFSDDAAHPGVLGTFRRSIAAVAALPCDILLTPHPDASDLWHRLGPDATAPLVDAAACKRYAAAAARNLDARVAREKGTAKP
jgi:metallo-beta-lactamase class B